MGRGGQVNTTHCPGCSLCWFTQRRELPSEFAYLSRICRAICSPLFVRRNQQNTVHVSLSSKWVT